MASEENSNNSNTEMNMNSPSTSQQNSGNETYEDGNSIPSSANSLQMSMLESKLDSEITKMGKMMQNAISGLTEHVNQKLTSLDTKFNNLIADLVPVNQNSNVNSSDAQTAQNTERADIATMECSSHSRGDHSHFKMKPQNFSGESDFDEFLSQFEITCEINGWQYKEKSLYLANCLTGEARSLLSELDHDGRRDYNILVEKLANRFGSVNRSEIFRTQLKSRLRNKGESIPELAQAVKKLVRQAYPGVNKDVIETLSLDNFIDALTDSDIRLRVRELGPKTLAEAERVALRLESHKIADKQRMRLVGQLETDCRQGKEKENTSNAQLESLRDTVNTLSDQMKNMTKQNYFSTNNERYADGKFSGVKQHNNQNFSRNGSYNRTFKNNPPPTSGAWERSRGQFRGNYPRQNWNHNSYQNHTAQNTSAGGNTPRNRQNKANYPNTHNHRNTSGHFANNQGNGNQSVWGATTRQN